MTKLPSSASQMTLSLFDTSGLGWGLSLDASASPGASQFRAFADGGDAAPAAAAAQATLPAPSFRLLGDRGLAPGWKARAADTIAAIQLMQRIEAGEGAARPHRHATPAEQARLALFTGFGASELANSFFRRDGDAFRPGWEALGNSLEQLVSPEDMAALARSTQYAHYTPEYLVRAMWRALQHMGFAGGRILEPGCGAGLFLALRPETIAAESITAIEMDPTTARIAKLLYPEAWVRSEDFTKARLSETFDLAIGNPPFSDRVVRGSDAAGRLGLSLHEYFIARSIERLRPGGLAAFVCSRFLMDRVDTRARAHIGTMADLLGAVRLPQAAMLAASGTEVVADLLFFEKRAAGQEPGPVAWDSLAEVEADAPDEAPLSVNRYFAERPEMVLGRHAWTSSAYGPIYTCRAATGRVNTGDAAAALQTALDAALATLPTGRDRDRADDATSAPAPAGRPSAARDLDVGTAAEGAALKEGSFVLIDDVLMQVVDGQPVEVPVKSASDKTGMFAKHARIIKLLIPVRDTLRTLLRAQMNEEGWGPLQIKLRVAYGAFTRAFGPINLTSVSHATDPETGLVRETVRRPNLAPFADDPDCWLVASIEEYDQESGIAKRGPVFTERVIHPPAEPHISSAADALAVVLAECGHVDVAAIAERIGVSREQALAELGEAVFLDPGLSTETAEAWETADAYLSGPVRTKLAVAEAAATLNPRFARNVAALRRVQPEDLRPSDITARPGAPWIAADVVEAFAAEVIGVATTVRHTVEIAAWSVDLAPFIGQAAATSAWGTARRHAGLLLDDALNSAIPTIWDHWRDADGVEHRQVNAEETEAAKEKLEAIKRAFEDWIWQDAERADRLTRVYNDRFNNLAPRQFDGAHLTLPGASSAIRFRAHQLRGIWRIVASGSTYLAHTVGAGKTFLMVAAIMEQLRLGLISKAMMVVPGHCLAQASREFLLLYPNARILVADESNFVAGKRQRFLARAATACWDCIIITHSAFRFIPTPASFERGMVAHEVRTLTDLLEKLDGEDKITRKRIEAAKERLEAKLEALATRKDDMLTIAEIGIDHLVVDEAQEFRKLSFTTNMANLKGVQPDGSQRAWDLYVKTRFIDGVNPGRALVMASGTPITNTLAEMFTVQRFLQPEALAERGLHQFDAWAASFGKSATELELQPSGLYKPVTRFAEFVNVADLMALFRSFADVVGKRDLRGFLDLPAIETGQRQLITAPPSPTFRWYQQVLARRIAAIEHRKRRVEKGDDILLSVITDGRHAAIDLRFVLQDYADEAENKLNALIARVHAIWADTADRRYRRPDGLAYPVRGAAQMIFSDLGTIAVEATRGFSAYRWIRDQLIARGVPAGEIAFMQDTKKSSDKQRLFQDVNAGRVRILIGSSETMGTGVNAQTRLVALHHLDVPWLPSQIEQREGRIERQGNQNESIGLYAYATLGSTDATMWQNNERKQRFIDAALSGDRSVRRVEDVGSQVGQFAMAKAIASGDARLMHKAGLEAEVARLQRQKAAHLDDQQAVRRAIVDAQRGIEAATRQIGHAEADLAHRTPTGGDSFAMTVDGQSYAERKEAGAALLGLLRNLDMRGHGDWVIGRIGGFDIAAARHKQWGRAEADTELTLERSGGSAELSFDLTGSALGLVSRLEHALDRFEAELATHKWALAENRKRLVDYQPRLGLSFGLQAELDDKEAELAAVETSLAETTAETAGQPAFDLGPVMPRLRGAVLDMPDEPGASDADEAGR